MSLEHERIVHTDAPSPEQLMRMAQIGVRSAVRREKLRKMPKNRDPRGYYVIDELDKFETSPYQFEDHLLQTRHRMSVRVGSREPDLIRNKPKTWSLKFYDVFYARNEAEEQAWTGERTAYRFEWSRTQTLLAERSFHAVGLEKPDHDIADYILNFSLPDDAASTLYFNSQMEQITSSGAEELAQNLDEYFGEVERVHSMSK